MYDTRVKGDDVLREMRRDGIYKASCLKFSFMSKVNFSTSLVDSSIVVGREAEWMLVGW